MARLAQPAEEVHGRVGGGEAHCAVQEETSRCLDQAAPPAEVTDDQLVQAVTAAVAGGMSKKDAAASVARTMGVGRNRVYALANNA